MGYNIINAPRYCITGSVSWVVTHNFGSASYPVVYEVAKNDADTTGATVLLCMAFDRSTYINEEGDRNYNPAYPVMVAVVKKTVTRFASPDDDGTFGEAIRSRFAPAHNGEYSVVSK